MFDVFELQKQLVLAARPSGTEQGIGALIAALAKPFCDEIRTDALGNVICRKAGPGKKIMFSAHMDVIGFIALKADKSGNILVDKIGGQRVAQLNHTPVRFENGVCGVVRELTAAADKAGVTWQYRLSANAGNDAGPIHQANGGCEICTVSAPIRYMHSACNVAHYADLEAMEQLARIFVNEVTDRV